MVYVAPFPLGFCKTDVARVRLEVVSAQDLLLLAAPIMSEMDVSGSAQSTG